MVGGEPPHVYGEGERTLDFVHVDDVVRVNVLASNGGKVLNVGCGRGVSINELVATLIELLGADLDPIYEDPRPGDVRHSYADVSMAEAVLGFTPEEDLGGTIEYYDDR